MNVRFLKPLSIMSLSFFIFVGCGMLPYRNDFQCQKGKNSGVCNSVSDVYELSSDMDDLRLRTLDGKSEEEIEEIQKDERKKALELAKNEFKTQKLQEMVEAYEIRQIQNEQPVIFRFFLDGERDNTKSYLAAYDAKNKTTQAKKKAKKSKKNTKKANTSKNAGKKQAKSAGLLAESNASKDINASLENYANNYIAGRESNASKVLDDNASLYANGKDLNASGFGKDSNSSENLQDLLDNAYAQGKASVDCSASGGKRTEINAKVKVCVYAANIRKEPSCKAQVLRIANKGEVLEVLYEQDGWVRLNDGTYIHKSIITRD